MKLIAVALGALALHSINADTSIHLKPSMIRGDGSMDDDLLPVDFGVLRQASDGGSCPVFTRQEAYDTLKSNMYDFRSAQHVKLSETGPVTMTIGERKKFKALKFRKRKYKQAKINGYDGTVKLAHPSRINDYINLNIAKYNYDGGVFLCQKCTDKSYLTYMFGNLRKGKTGFIPTTAYIMTFLYLSTASGGCPSDTGNSVQIVVAFGSRGKSRIIYNYGPTNNLDSVPTIGLWDVKGPSEKLLNRLDGSPITAFEDVSENTYMIVDWYITSNAIKVVSGSPLLGPSTDSAEGSQTCGNKKHCLCNNIVDEFDNIKFQDPVTKTVLAVGDVTTHFSFKGRCSRSSTTMATGGYGGRGHICYVSPLSTQCTNDGNNSNKLWNRITIEGENYDVPGYRFTCSEPQQAGDEPYWQRSVSKTETKLVIRVKAESKRKRRGTRPKWAAKKRKEKIAAKKASADKVPTFCDKSEENREFCDAMAGLGPERKLVIRPKETTTVMCNMYCEHPNVWSAEENVSFGPYDDVDFKRGGTWVCTWTMVDGNGDTQTVESNGVDDVPEGAWCKLQCGSSAGDDDTSDIHCNTWKYPRGFEQYDRDEVKVLANLFTTSGWTCPP